MTEAEKRARIAVLVERVREEERKRRAPVVDIGPAARDLFAFLGWAVLAMLLVVLLFGVPVPALAAPDAAVQAAADRFMLAVLLCMGLTCWAFAMRRP